METKVTKLEYVAYPFGHHKILENKIRKSSSVLVCANWKILIIASNTNSILPLFQNKKLNRFQLNE